jgi:hypothetical protein
LVGLGRWTSKLIYDAFMVIMETAKPRGVNHDVFTSSGHTKTSEHNSFSSKVLHDMHASLYNGLGLMILGN